VEHALFSPQFFADPHPTLRRLRAEDPVHWVPAMGIFLATRYDDVATVTRSERFTAERPLRRVQTVPPELAELIAEYDRFLGHWMNRADPPRHTRLRALVGNAFTPQRIDALRPFIREIVGEQVDAARDAGRMDVVRDLGYPVPIAVICQMLGVPPEDRGAFQGWTQAITRTAGATALTREVAERALWGVHGLSGYFHAILAERRRAPTDDLLSAMVRVDAAGNVLSDEELASTAALLLAAGHETTTHLIGNAIFTLLDNPEELRRLRADPTLVASAVEEVLRYESPVLTITRVALADTELSGQTIQAGQVVAAVLAAANRDAARFPDPDRMDIGRTDNRHFGLGVGLHYCLGAQLARVETQIVLEVILEKLPALALTGETLSWVPNLLMHGLSALPVTCAA
jgi:cytochrome P450